MTRWNVGLSRMEEIQEMQYVVMYRGNVSKILK